MRPRPLITRRPHVKGYRRSLAASVLVFPFTERNLHERMGRFASTRQLHRPVQIRKPRPPGADHATLASSGATLSPARNRPVHSWIVLILTRLVESDAKFRRVGRFYPLREGRFAKSHELACTAPVCAAKSAIPAVTPTPFGTNRLLREIDQRSSLIEAG